MRISDWSSDVCSSDLIYDIVYVINDVVYCCNGLPFIRRTDLMGSRCLAYAGGQPAGLGDLHRRRHCPLRPRHGLGGSQRRSRSEEHTSELQSLMRISYAVFCLKKKQLHNTKNTVAT